ncbi:hypothetical protein VNO78_10432 [Psophocarpus tetragonolobus]|uniref:Transmembrane protein n=1 Tax=Psophocarpus tetragonolobus TaxID=3891 RepID=A0AAN9SRE9_PSOTE
MDPTQMKKIEAMNRYKIKKREFLDNLAFYFLSGSVFCCVTLFLPYLSSVMVHISCLIPVLLSSKLLFIIGNLIIFFLVLNSRILSSDSSSTCVVYYDEYIQSSQTTKLHIPSPEGKGCVQKATEASKDACLYGDQQKFFPSDELNRRADDFIARVNRQRRLELSLLH